jgi:ElaB/YqjD/DUF883 family membrane-anchored ribosome-binding protein
MPKLSDREILAIRARVEAGETVTAACREAGISTVTYYARTKKLDDALTDARNTLTEISDTVPLTIQRLDHEANVLLDELNSMKDGWESDKHDKLDVIREIIKLLSSYRRALQTATLALSQTTINVCPSDEQWEHMWGQFIDPALRRAGVEPERIQRVAEAIDAEWRRAD